MSAWSGLILAIVVPWLAVGLWLQVLSSAKTATDRLGLYATAYLFSMLLTAGMLYLSARLSGAFHYPVILATWIALLIAGVLWHRPWRLDWRLMIRGWVHKRYRDGNGPRWQGMLFWLLLVLIVVRLAGLAIENTHQPMMAWDAWVVWAARAKAWFYAHQMVPFVAEGEWLRNAHPSFYTISAWNYPKTVSLIQLWSALALGRWDDALISLPWLLALVALAMSLYSALRQAQVAAWLAIAGVWFLVSLPIFDAHVALAGYGGLWLTLAFTVGLFGLLAWHRQRDPVSLVLSLLALGLMLLIKSSPGMLLLLVVAPAILWLLPLRLRIALPLLALVVLAGGLALTGGHISLGSLGVLSLTSQDLVLPVLGAVRPDFVQMGREVGQFIFGQDSWHMLWGMLLIAFVALLPRVRQQQMAQMVLLVFAAAVVIYGVSYASPRLLDVISNGTVVNRGLMYLAPLALFAIAYALGAADPERAREVDPSDS